MKALLLLTAAAAAASAQTPEVSITTPKAQPVVGRLLAPFHLEKRTVPPAKLANYPAAGTIGAGRQPLPFGAGRDCAGARKQSRYRGAALWPVSGARSAAAGRRGRVAARHRSTRRWRPGPTSVSTAGISTSVDGLAGGAGICDRAAESSPASGPIRPAWIPPCMPGFSMGHTTTPLTNTQLNGTTALTNSYRQRLFRVCAKFHYRHQRAVTFGESRSLLNSATPLFNPSLAGYLDLYFTQPLLQGFSIGVNNRDIKVAKNNLKVSDLQVKLQVVDHGGGGAEPLLGPGELQRSRAHQGAGAEDRAEAVRRQQEAGRDRGAGGYRSDARGGGGFGQQRGPADRADQRSAAGDRPEERAQPKRHAERLAGRRAHRSAGPHRGSRRRTRSGRCRT